MNTIQDMTLSDLEQLIEEKILEASKDPDEDLQIRDEIKESLQERRKEKGKLSHEEITEQYG